MSQDNIEKEINELTEKIALEPENAELYSDRGACYWEDKDYDKAIKDFTRAIELEPENTIFYLFRGICYRGIKNYGKAIEDYTKAIELKSENAEFYSTRGICYMEIENYNSALTDYNKAIELNFKYAKAYAGRGKCYFEMKNYDEALKDCYKAVDFDPKCAEAYLVYGKCYVERENYDEALKNFDKAIKLNPKCAEACENRGDLYYKIKDDEKAKADYKRAYKFAPSEKICRNLIELYQKTENFTAAIETAWNLMYHNQSYFNEINDIVDNAQEVIRIKEREKSELRTKIFQAVSHTISNIMVANKSITKRIKNGTNSMNDVNRLELLNDLVLSTMNAVKLAFSNENIVFSRAQDELFYEKVEDGISLHNLLWFCLNINLYYLVVGEGEEAWATIRNRFFSINRYDKKDVGEKLNMLKEMRKSPHFSISELSDDQISGFADAFRSEQFEAVHQFFAVQIEELRNLYVKKDSYTFSVLFIILLELTKNMLRYGTIEDRRVRKFTMKSETDGDYVILTLANICQKSGLNLKESTLKGLAMIQEFSKLLGRFEQSKKDMENSELLEFEAKLFIKRPEHQDTVKKEII